MKRLNLIDGYGYVFRAFYGLPPLTNTKGEPIGAVFGFCRMMLKFMKQRPDELFLAVFDTGHLTFRNEIYKEYKSHRKEAPEDLKKQFPIIRHATQALGISQIEKENYEADDLIATYAKLATAQGYRVSIISGDKDFMQLLSNPNVTMFHPIKEQDLTLDDVTKKFGVAPEKVVDVQAIMGDATDNIPGIPGIGPKGAAELILKFGHLENIYNHLDEIPKSKRKELLIQYKDLALISKQLVTLKDDVPVPTDFEDMHLKEIDTNFLQENGFKSLVPADIKKTSSHTKVAGLSEFLEKASNSLEVYIRITKDNSIHCYVSQHEYHYTKSLSECLVDFKAILENPGIVKIFHSVKTIIQECHKLNIHLENYQVLESMSLCVFCGKHDQSLETLESYYHTINFYPTLKKDLMEAHALSLYERAERFLPEVLVYMEEQGIQIDPPYLTHLSHELDHKLKTLEQKIYEDAGETFNLNSPQQLGVILFEKLKLPPTEKTKTGQYSTDSDALEKINTVITRDILEYRQWSKLLNTYVLPLLEKQVDHRIHTTFIHNTVLTGRLSSKNPNLQNIPVKMDEIRKAFIAPQGSKIISFDYSQIELRLAAHMSQEPTLINAFKHGEDIHAATARELFGTVTDETRRHAKVINFGILYGMGAHGLSENLGVSKQRAQEIIDQYFEKYPKIKEYVETKKHEAKTRGFVTTIFNKRIYIQHIQDRFAGTAERQSINAPLQGSSADLIKMAMTKIYRWLQNENLKTKMILQIHDELLFETPEEEIEIVTTKVKSIMENIETLSVPIVTNVSIGQNWLDVS